MTQLNLIKHFTAQNPANDRFIWTLTTETKTREDLICLSAFLGYSLKPFFLLDEKTDPLLIAITGTGGGGKSMIAEAMMKAMLDQTNPLDMLKPDASQTMFIESRSAEACDNYCYAFGTTDGVPALYAFDRVSGYQQKTLKDNFYKAAHGLRPEPKGGAVFMSRGSIDLSRSNSWLHINMSTPDGEYNGFRRIIKIEVLSSLLKADPRFQASWRKLGEAADANNYKDLPLTDRIAVRLRGAWTRLGRTGPGKAVRSLWFGLVA